MPILVDSHCHLDILNLKELKMNLADIIDEAYHKNVKYILSICLNIENLKTIIPITKKFNNIYASIGKHPNEIKGKEPSTLDLINIFNAHSKIIAIGESGLDYYRTKSEKHILVQKKRFINHIQASKKLNAPLIIHTRYASQDTIAILEKYNVNLGVVHCFTESWEMAKIILDMGLYISFSGILTFKNSENLRDLVRKIPLNRILIETDSPYLTPHPFRGKSNKPSYVNYVAKCISKIKNLSYSDICHVTTDNFSQLFNIQIF